MEEEKVLGFEETADNFTQYLFSLAHQKPLQLLDITYLDTASKHLQEIPTRRHLSDHDVKEGLGRSLLQQQEDRTLTHSSQELAAELILAEGLTFAQTVSIFESRLAQAEALPMEARERLGISERGFNALQDIVTSQINGYMGAIGRRHVFPVPDTE